MELIQINKDGRLLTPTARLVSVGAEYHMLKEYRVLDHGYIKLVDYMGRDETVVAAARHSYGGRLDLSDNVGNERLIKFLMRNRHTSPFEQCSLAFEVFAPIFVFRQWHRHRTPRLNEHSGRYAEMPDVYYVPELEDIKVQRKGTQGGDENASLSLEDKRNVQNSIRHVSVKAYNEYIRMVNMGVALETARLVLPVNFYSKMVWQIDLHNMTNFMRLRCDNHAQLEIRRFAQTMEKVVADAYPMVYNAWKEYSK